MTLKDQTGRESNLPAFQLAATGADAFRPQLFEIASCRILGPPAR